MEIVNLMFPCVFYLLFRGLATGWLESVSVSKTYRLANPREKAVNEKRASKSSARPPVASKPKRSVQSRTIAEENSGGTQISTRKNRGQNSLDFFESDNALARAELLAKKAVKMPIPRRSDIEAGRAAPPLKRPLLQNGSAPRGRPPKHATLQVAAAESLAMIADALLEMESVERPVPKPAITRRVLLPKLEPMLTRHSTKGSGTPPELADGEAELLLARAEGKDRKRRYSQIEESPEPTSADLDDAHLPLRKRQRTK